MSQQIDLNKVRAVYTEAQGFLSQIPPLKDAYDTTRNVELANLINFSIDELNKLVGIDYTRFKIKIEKGYERDFVYVIEYRTKLGGIISRLHAEYFSNEPAPFGGSPSTIITQNQTQQQTAQITLLLEVQSKIDEKLHKTNDPQEKNFLETVKSKLILVKNVTDFITLILTTAQSMSISIDKLQQIFK